MTNENDTAMDPNGLFREENFTDQKMGSIRKLVPVKADGSDDPDRTTEFFGSAQVMTPMGQYRLTSHWTEPLLVKRRVTLPARRKLPLRKLAERLKECAESRRLKSLCPVRAVAAWVVPVAESLLKQAFFNRRVI